MHRNKIRWGVVVKDVYYNEQDLERHRSSYYVAKVISSNPGELDGKGGRVEVFGRTFGEIDFLETDSEEEAREIVRKFSHDEFVKTRKIRQ